MQAFSLILKNEEEMADKTPKLEPVLTLDSRFGKFVFEEPTIGKRLELELRISAFTQGMPMTVTGQNLAWSVAALQVLPTIAPAKFDPTTLKGRERAEVERLGSAVWEWLQKIDAGLDIGSDAPEADLKS